jgi:hypothetical protein
MLRPRVDVLGGGDGERSARATPLRRAAPLQFCFFLSAVDCKALRLPL